MIEVIKVDNAERKTHHGRKEVVIPAYTDELYRYDGKLIARTFRHMAPDCKLYIRTNFTLTDFDKPLYERALSGCYGEAFKELFDMIGVDEDTEISEFMYA